MQVFPSGSITHLQLSKFSLPTTPVVISRTVYVEREHLSLGKVILEEMVLA